MTPRRPGGGGAQPRHGRARTYGMSGQLEVTPMRNYGLALAFLTTWG